MGCLEGLPCPLHFLCSGEGSIESTGKVISTICHLCNNGCGMKVWLEKDRIVKVEGDASHPVSLGSLCTRWLAATQLECDSKRILHPLIRRGVRGEGQWQQVPLDEVNRGGVV